MKNGTFKGKKKKKQRKQCLYCESCIPIGGGDHFCDEQLVIVIEDYTPNENYCCCKKKGGEQNDR